MRSKQSLTLLILLYKKQIRNIGYMLTVVLLPVIIAILINTNSLTKSTGNNIGLYCRSDNERANTAIDYLVEGDYYVNFIRYTDRNELVNDIANSRIDCAYELPDNLSDTILHNSKDSIILDLYDSETILSSYSNEIVYNAILRSIATDMLLDYAEHNKYLNNKDIKEHLIEIFDSYVGTSDVFTTQKISLTDKDTVIDEKDFTSDYSTTIRYISGILVMLTALIGAVYRAENFNSSAFEVMDGKLKFITAFIYPLAYATPILLSTTILIIATGSANGLADIINVLLLLITSTLLASVISIFVTNSKAIAGMIPIFLMVSVSIYPVFFDFEMFMPWIHYLKFLLPPQYLNLL